MTGKQLKNTILQEAIEGRLVPQDPNDEPASVLLDKIRKEKARLVKEGKLKKKDLVETPVEDDEIPFNIPESWTWIRFGDLVFTSTGKTPARGEVVYWSSNDYPWVSISDMKQGEVVNSTKEFISKKAANDCFHNEISKKGTLIMSFKLTVGRTSILGMDAFHNEAIISIKTYADNDNYTRDYLAYILPIIANSGDSKDAIKGKTLNSKSIYNLLVPLPPLAEQKRIVAKIEELLPKVEEYGKAQEALDKLNEELPERLKKSILQEAITGHLVPQDPNDEPASVLLDKIRAEKKRLVKEGKLKKKDLVETPVEEDEKPFEIPESWEWVRFGTITINRDRERIPLSVDERSKLEKKYDYYGASGVIDKVDRFLFNKPLLLIGEDGANLINRSTPIAFIARGEYWVNNHAHVLDYINEDLMQFVCWYINAISLVNYVTGTAQPKMNQEKMNSILVALPPLAEQKRIVAKIEEVFKEIDKLKNNG